MKTMKELQAKFGAACTAAASMMEACTALAKDLLGSIKLEGDLAKLKGAKLAQAQAKAAVALLGELVEQSKDANASAVRRYTSEAVAILADDSGAAVPTVAKERTEKAQKARSRMGTARAKGAKSAKAKGAKAKGAKAKGAKATKWQDGFAAAIKTQPGRAEIVKLAKAAGYAITFAMAEGDTKPRTKPRTQPAQPAQPAQAATL